MERHELEELRERVPCAAVLENAGFVIVSKGSTPRAVKYRNGDDIIIVIYNGQGWFDPLSDAKGDVFKLVEYLDRVTFRVAIERVAELVNFEPVARVWIHQRSVLKPDTSVVDRWLQRRVPWRGSASWQYLRDQRVIPESVIQVAVQNGTLREGPHGSMWAAHTDDNGVVTGWEERGPDWRGFAAGGTKVLFRFGNVGAVRLCVTEAAIDAMSLAAIENKNGETLYLSTGGGWSPTTEVAIRTLVQRLGVLDLSRFISASSSLFGGYTFELCG